MGRRCARRAYLRQCDRTARQRHRSDRHAGRERQSPLDWFGPCLRSQTNSFYGITDRGPGGGTIAYNPRAHRFTLDIDPGTGAISNFSLKQTLVFRDPAGTRLNGLNPTALNGSPATLGNSFDSEGIAVGRDGRLFVSDEYGPAIVETNAGGKIVRHFTTPDNLLPRVNGVLNFADATTTGRQDNRGFEGIAIAPDGKTLFAVVQDPLQQEGVGSNPGRRSRNVRVVRFDIATGAATGQFVYQLDTLATINEGAAVADQFGATSQGRNIGLSGITALNDHQFLVIERDNRGAGIGTSALTPLIKSVKLIDITGATDVSTISLAGTNDALPSGVVPVGKSSFIDVLAALRAAGQVVPEKIEGLAIGPSLDLDGDGIFDDLSFVLATDNDFSVTQNGSNVQFDECLPDALPAGGPYTDVPLDTACPGGTVLLPSFLLGFVLKGEDLARQGIVVQPRAVSEPATLALLGLGAFALTLRRRRG